MYSKDPRKNCFEIKGSSETVWVCVCSYVMERKRTYGVCNKLTAAQGNLSDGIDICNKGSKGRRGILLLW